jgi:ribosomal protein S18 acetylase RimI-like enzyme
MPAEDCIAGLDSGLAGYELSTDANRLDIDAIHAYLRRSYWSAEIPRTIVERAARHSLCIGAYESATGAQVGFARVVTDQATFAYLCDVYVLERHRGRGLSKAMVRAIMHHTAVKGARRVMLATRDAHGLYRRFGFRQVSANANLMQIVRPDIYGGIPD